ncbi:MAG: aromatic acid exporter family protein [Faecousia sp.]
MKNRPSKLHIGMRTIKTAAAVILSMIVVDCYGATTSKLIFAMLGAMAVIQPTFTESVESCLTQIVGVLFGAVVGVILMALPIHPLLATGIGIILVITIYNLLHIQFSPALPCLIVVTLCSTADIQPIAYALGRIWDTTIGLIIGMVLNSLVFPYDNSRQIRSTVESLDQELIGFLEEMFDGDDILPDAKQMTTQIDAMSAQLSIFSNQKLLLHLRRQKQQLEVFRTCEGKARALVAQMEVLCQIGRPGRLTDENRRRLTACGADIRDQRPLDSVLERDVVTNYHVSQILTLRRELLEALKKVQNG